MNSDSKQTFTFAEMYQQRLQMLRSSGSIFFLERHLPTMSVSSCQQELRSFADSLESDPESSIGKLKANLTNLPRQLHQSFMEWTNPRGMDILQLCVLYDRSDIISALLENSCLFPETHTPKLNPYAHLAAILGHKACLEALLTHRPGFYFKSSKPQHAIKLPKEHQSRLRMKEGSSAVNKYVQKLLKKIGEGSRKAEKSLENNSQPPSSPSCKSEEDILDKEMAASMISKPSRRMPHRNPSVSFQTNGSEKRKHSSSNMSTGHDQMNDAKNCSRRLKKGEHVITVHKDCFDLENEPEGVVRGAGPSAKVVRPHDGVAIIKQSKLPCIEDVRVLRQRSKLGNQKPTATPNYDFAGKSKTKVTTASSYSLGKSTGNISNSSSNAPLTRTGSPHNSGKSNSSSASLTKKIDFGVRTIKRYKDFQVVIDSRTLAFKEKYMNKTPLTLAAEKGQLDCVTYLLQNFLLKQQPALSSYEPLTLATQVRSPEAIALLLSGKRTREDLQGAILTALRQFYPACLTVLLSAENIERSHLFGGENLFHIFYSQSLNSDYRYEMMPEMTRTLIGCKEDVNARGTGSTHPMYTLIRCAFNIKVGKQFLYYLDCLKILLAARANPHYNELREENLGAKSPLSISREFYYSAIHCVFASAERSMHFFEKPSWAKIIMQKFIDCIVNNDKTSRRILNDVLFCYMDYINHLGFDRKILRSLLRYGANPDYKYEDNYAINTFFNEMLPFLTQFEISSHEAMLDALLSLSQAMSPSCLQEAFVLFLDNHLMRTPLQAMPLTRRFCYEVNRDLRQPRPLSKLTASFIWKRIRRNSVNARKLPVKDYILDLIIPSH